MNAAQVDRTRVAARAAAAGRSSRSDMRYFPAPAPVEPPAAPHQSRRGTRLTATQRNAQGRVSEWSRSPYAPRGGWR